MCLPLPASPKQVCNRVSYAMLTPASAPDGNGVPAAAEPAALLCCSWRVHKVLAGRLPLTGRLPLAHVWHTHLSELLHKLQRS